MRLRNQSLKTGKGLAWIDPEGKAQPRVLLFLVQGADDIAPLSVIESVCRPNIEDLTFKWHPIADPGQLSLVDARLFRANVVRFEACEFAGLNDGEVAVLLKPVIEHIVSGDAELLPRVGGAVGGPAEGVQFLNRVAELNTLAADLRNGESLSLQAPRRTGKTSLMRLLQARLDGEFTPLALNLERDPTPAEVAARLRSQLTADSFRTALRAAQANPAASAKESMETLCRKSAKPVVVFIDELVALFNSIKERAGGESARRQETLAFLRALGVPLEAHGGRLVAAGSVDWLDYLRAQLGLDAPQLPGLFARMRRVPLKPLDFEHPECELRRLLLGSELVAETGDFEWLRDHVDLTVPFPALRFLDVLLSETRQHDKLNEEDFARLFADYLTNTESFDDFDEHLRRKSPDGPKSSDLLADALNVIAREPFDEGTSEDAINAILAQAGTEEIEPLRAWLRDTFPVTFNNGRVRFVSRLFRHWWRSQNPLETGAGE